MGARLRRRSPFTVALLLALAVVTLWWQLAERRARHESARAARAEARLAAVADSLHRRLGGGLGTPGGTGRRPASLVPDSDLEGLRARGLADPVRQVRADLAAHPELIPFKGVLGGTMGFYATDEITVLNGEWVYADFDDGHIGGYGVFRYRVAPGGRIAWTCVTAKLEE